MQPKDWTVCLIEPNKFEAKIILDLLRTAGVAKLKHFTDSAAAMEALTLYPANVIIGAVESAPMDGVDWTRAFRRNRKVVNRKAAVFLTSGAFSLAVAERCRHGGANALIGKPVSGKTLTATITKVLTHPREFIDAEGYVGPCRRAGIVTAGPNVRRRKVDKAAEPALAPDGEGVVAKLLKAVGALAAGGTDRKACEEALNATVAAATRARDTAMVRACQALARQLSAPDLQTPAAKIALEACVSGITRLASVAAAEQGQRDALAEEVCAAVAKAAAQKAA